jgi:2-polyprenyl-6-methoxyphenol hydroxylase-like FAD-dependent oxidoreductase
VERPRDWNIGLHWGTPILQSLIPSEAFAQLESAQVDPNTPCLPEDTIPFLHGQTGEQIGGTTVPHVYRLRRKELRSIISKGLDIEYNKTLTALEYSEDGKTVTATFQDGSSYTGSLVVGADGARSEVRNLVVGQPGAELTVLPFACSIVQAKFTAEQAKFLRSVHPLYLAMIHPEGMVGWLGLHHAPDPNVPEDWIMNHYISWPCSPEEYDKTKDFDNYQRLKQVQSLAEKFADPIKSAFLWLPKDQDVWFSMITQWDPSLPEHAWDNKDGRVTLAGDAAHPMTFRKSIAFLTCIQSLSQPAQPHSVFSDKK